MLFGQPRAVFLIAALEMWESFSYYGMRSILILFLTGSLLYSDEDAYTLYAVYISLVEIGGVFGGFLADRYFGSKKSIYIGGSIIVLGHLCMLGIPLSDRFLLFALGLIAAGSALFRVNCATLLGELYEKNDPRLQSGFTIYYASLNVGAFLAIILCGFVAQSFGWQYGFSLAGFGMLIGLAIFIRGRKLLEGKGSLVKQTNSSSTMGIFYVLLLLPIAFLLVHHSEITMRILPFILGAFLIGITVKSLITHHTAQRSVLLILAATILLSIFYACEELIGTSIILFAERMVDRSFFGFVLPSSSLNSVNPITIIILGVFVSRYLLKHTTSENTFVLHSFKTMSYAFLIMSLAFVLLLFSNLASLIGAFALIAAAELFIGPVVYSLCTRLAPATMRGQSMGMVMLGYSLAGLMSGYLGKYLMISEEGGSDFYSGFTTICIGTALVGLSLFILSRWVRAKEWFTKLN